MDKNSIGLKTLPSGNPDVTFYHLEHTPFIITVYHILNKNMAIHLKIQPLISVSVYASPCESGAMIPLDWFFIQVGHAQSRLDP